MADLVALFFMANGLVLLFYACGHAHEMTILGWTRVALNLLNWDTVNSVDLVLLSVCQLSFFSCPFLL